MLVSIFILFLMALSIFCEYRALESDYKFFKGLGLGFSVDDIVGEKGLKLKEVQIVVLCFYVNYTLMP